MVCAYAGAGAAIGTYMTFTYYPQSGLAPRRTAMKVKKLVLCASLLFWVLPAFAYTPVHFQNFAMGEKLFFGILVCLGIALFVIIKVLQKTRQ